MSQDADMMEPDEYELKGFNKNHNNNKIIPLLKNRLTQLCSDINENIF